MICDLFAWLLGLWCRVLDLLSLGVCWMCYAFEFRFLYFRVLVVLGFDLRFW